VPLSNLVFLLFNPLVVSPLGCCLLLALGYGRLPLHGRPDGPVQSVCLVPGPRRPPAHHLRHHPKVGQRPQRGGLLLRGDPRVRLPVRGEARRVRDDRPRRRVCGHLQDGAEQEPGVPLRLYGQILVRDSRDNPVGDDGPRRRVRARAEHHPEARVVVHARLQVWQAPRAVSGRGDMARRLRRPVTRAVSFCIVSFLCRPSCARRWFRSFFG